jgi:hypothetical protein
MFMSGNFDPIGSNIYIMYTKAYYFAIKMQ